jgi:hypothetical protein
MLLLRLQGGHLRYVRRQLRNHTMGRTFTLGAPQTARGRNMVKKFEVLKVVEPGPYRTPVAKPCSDCPFRRKSMPGWLGAGSPESFIQCINTDDILPCHQTIDYEDRNWKEKWAAQTTGNVCAGALIMMANMCKHPRDPAFPSMPRDRETVFATPLEFVRHHREALAQSWDDAEQSDEAKYLQKLFVRHAKESGQPFKKTSRAPAKKARRRGV